MKTATLSAIVAATAAIPHWTQVSSSTYSFEEYEQEFGKVYANEEEREMRRAVFNKTIGEISSHNSNAAASGWHMNVNHISDMTDDEFRVLLGRKTAISKTMDFATDDETPDYHFEEDDITIDQLPKNVDWREQGIITPVKDQGGCGSCWAFGAAATIESYYALASGALTEVSPQQLVDCVPNPKHCGGSGGCHGSVESLAFQHVVEHGGIATPYTYGYDSYFGKDDAGCRNKPSAINSKTGRVIPDPLKPVLINSHAVLPRNDYLAVMRHLAFVGPLSVGIDASVWKNYKGGVFKGCPRGNMRVDQNHAVQLVGYGEDPLEGPYWLVRNSWTPSWGERGYIRIARKAPGHVDHCLWDVTPEHGSACEGDNEPVRMCGECGILFEPSFVKIGSPNAKPVNEDAPEAAEEKKKEDEKKDTTVKKIRV